MAARAKKEEEGAPEDPRPETRARAEAERDPLAALVEGLAEIHPGLEVLDRELALEGGARADLAAVDPSGRLHLVQLAADDGDRAALEALDALRALRAELGVLARHLGGGRVRADRPARLLVVAPRADARFLERLEALAEAGVAVYGLRSVKSAAGEATYLVPLRAEAEASGGVGAEPFLGALPARLEGLGRELVERMARLDEELAPAADATTLLWRLGQEALCRVERIDDRLEAGVAPRYEPFPLRGPADVERLVEESLARLVEVLGLTRRPPPEVGPRRVPQADEPILTPEEIEAFRQ
jgi:hypothetical protein